MRKTLFRHKKHFPSSDIDNKGMQCFSTDAE